VLADDHRGRDARTSQSALNDADQAFFGDQ
jgi:hypothetical protein